MTKLQTGLFTATIFVSAFLLFLVQPLFAKMILPVLGGTAAVWTTCMVFFQATLLAGYGYAHGLSQIARLPVQIGVHLFLVGLAFLTLPLIPPQLETSPEYPALWLLGFAVISIGLPFLVLSASAPLLQSWFSKTNHPNAHNPYFLYAASNIGSMVALLGYPFGIEAVLGLTEQRQLWFLGFGLLMITLVATAALTFGENPRENATSAPHHKTEKDQGNPWSQRLFWMICAALPSSLMLGLTSFVSTDLAPISLFWVVPLALYLLTFVIVFGFGRNISLKAVGTIAPMGCILGFWMFADSSIYGSSLSFYLSLALHVLVFFFIAWFFHGQLASSKPSATHLTDFYLWMSVGGMLGGVFNALVVPVLFRSTLEYPLVFLLCAFLIYKYLKHRGWTALFFNKEAVSMMVFVIFVGLGMDFLFPHLGNVLYRDRSFYGSIDIKTVSEENRVIHVLSHGSTTHGAQVISPKTEQSVPRGYYYREGLFGDVMKGYALNNPAPANLGMIGLGAGAMSTYSRAGDHLTFYEIDPMVVSIAQNPDYFTYWHQAKGEKKIVLGDARLSLTHTPDQHYDVLVVDAFSSDAIPVHLMTQQAIDLFLKKTKPTGAILVHISNRYLDLQKVIANYTLPAGYASYCGSHGLGERADLQKDFKYPHMVCLIAQTEDLPPIIKTNPSWKKTTPDPTFRSWTDDFSNIFNVFHM